LWARANLLAGRYGNAVAGGNRSRLDFSAIASILLTKHEISAASSWIVDCLRWANEELFSSLVSISWIDGARARIDDARARIDDARARIDDARARIDDARARIDGARARIDDARARIDDALDVSTSSLGALRVSTSSLDSDTSVAHLVDSLNLSASGIRRDEAHPWRSVSDIPAASCNYFRFRRRSPAFVEGHVCRLKEAQIRLGILSGLLVVASGKAARLNIATSFGLFFPNDAMQFT